MNLKTSRYTYFLATRWVALVAAGWLSNEVHSIAVEPKEDSAASATQVLPVGDVDPAAPANKKPVQITDAERIGVLKQLINDDELRLKQLRSELKAIEVEFESNSKDFSRLEAAVEQQQKQLEKRIADNGPPQTIDAERAALADGEARRKAAHASFDLVIRRRKATQSQIETLEEKLQLEKESLDRVTGVIPPQANASTSSEPRETSRSEEQSAATTKTQPSKAAAPTPGDSAANGEPAATSTGELTTDENRPLNWAKDPRVAEARRQFETQLEELQETEGRVERLSRAVDVFGKDLASEEELLATANEQVPVIEESLRRLQTQLDQQTASNDPEENIQATRKQIEDANGVLAKAKADAETHAKRVEALKSQLTLVESEKTFAMTEFNAAQAKTESADRWLRLLESPVAPHKLLEWLLSRGPKIIMILLILGGFWWLTRFLVRRMVRGLARRGGSGADQEREERADTVVGVLSSLTTVVVVGIGMLTVLDQAGVDVTVLMGGAAAMGVAIGFGAQNLMRDYFYGSMILAENQYRVGNVVEIAGISGQVESISLRITVLRDLHGVVHFIPHSQITTVSNLTHGWSRALFEIGIAYKEDVDQVMDELMTLACELRKDESYRGMILDDPEMLGVDAFGDSAVVIKFFVKTRPMKQWLVKRELLRRIKNRFDEVGIEIPFPHRTVYYRELPSQLETDGRHVQPKTTPSYLS